MIQGMLVSSANGLSTHHVEPKEEEVHTMSGEWRARLLQEHVDAIARHQRYIAAHEAILRILQAVEQQTITEAQAIVRLEEAAALLHEPGVAATYRQTIERLRQRRESRG